MEPRCLAIVLSPCPAPRPISCSEEQNSREAGVALALTQALWEVFGAAERGYDEAGEPTKVRRPAPSDLSP